MREFVFTIPHPEDLHGTPTEIPVKARNVTEARRMLEEWCGPGIIDADLYEPQCVTPEPV
jgi:hypothetical protein